jgi:hypothetical protein
MFQASTTLFEKKFLFVSNLAACDQTGRKWGSGSQQKYKHAEMNKTGKQTYYQT